jgi:hypothetical protein
MISNSASGVVYDKAQNGGKNQIAEMLDMEQDSGGFHPPESERLLSERMCRQVRYW